MLQLCKNEIEKRCYSCRISLILPISTFHWITITLKWKSISTFYKNTLQALRLNLHNLSKSQWCPCTPHTLMNNMWIYQFIVWNFLSSLFYIFSNDSINMMVDLHCCFSFSLNSLFRLYWPTIGLISMQSIMMGTLLYIWLLKIVMKG